MDGDDSRRRSRRAHEVRPRPARAIRPSVPGSGTAVGVYVRDRVCPSGSNLQPNAPAIGFWKPVVSNAVEAVNAAGSAGPEYAPAHDAAGHEYGLAGSKSAIGPATSVPTVVGLTSVSRWTVSGWAAS